MHALYCSGTLYSQIFVLEWLEVGNCLSDCDRKTSDCKGNGASY